MNTSPNIVGYGLCGQDEPYLRQTLDEFKRLCDEVIILCNNSTQDTMNLIRSYGFDIAFDNREWGKYQWKMKEDFVKSHVMKKRPDLCVCLDMDEVFDKELTKEKLIELYNMPHEAFYFWIVNLWDDGYCRERNFWNIRAWKPVKANGLEWKRTPVHCGLAPAWAYYYGFYSPYLLKHYGLQDAERRAMKSKRYDTYDPNSKFMQPEYYQSLRGGVKVIPFNEDELHQEVVEYVTNIKQKITKRTMENKEYVYIKTKAGETALVPKNKIQDYLKQGCQYVGEYKELENTLDEILNEDPAGVEPDYVAPTITANEVQERVEVFRCGQCGKEFDSQKGLRGHSMGAHQNQHIKQALEETVEKVKRWSWN
jgi:hypothetical protein